MALWLSAAESPEDELPAYLADPDRPGRPDRTWERALLDSARGRARQLALTLTGPRAMEPIELGGQLRSGFVPAETRPDLSSGFLRLMDLPGCRLAAMLEDWWRAAAQDRVAVGRGLQLGEPRGDSGRGWIMHGAMRRLTGLHWVPVVVDMWSYHDDWTMVTMSPQARVRCSQHYFRAGHAALDRLAAALAATPAGRAR